MGDRRHRARQVAANVMANRQQTAEALRDTFPAHEDAPLALTLLGLLARGEPVTLAALARASGRGQADVTAQLGRWPNVERDATVAVVGFSGLTLRETAHVFEIDGQRLHTWCAWDTLFLPSLLGATAHVRSACPMTSSAIELVVSPTRVEHANPPDVHVSFPSLVATDTRDITGSFCCHVHFLASDDAARDWLRTHPDGETLDVASAFALGHETVAQLTPARAPGSDVEVVRTAWEAFARGDLDVALDLLDAHVRWYPVGDPDGGCHNRDEARAFIRRSLADGVTAELLDVHVAGGRLVAVIQAHVPAERELRPEPHGELITVRDGKITEIVVYGSVNEALAAASLSSTQADPA